MKVLGLNGVYPRSHDASACLINDEQISALVEEERFVRSRRAFDHRPHNAIAYCLKSSGVSANDIDVVAFGWMGNQVTDRQLLPPLIANSLERKIEVVQMVHHEAHASSVFNVSPFGEAAILVIDGQGENESTTIWSGDEKGIRKLNSYDINHSLGYLYASVAKFCGQGTFGGGKLMGLAPYGEPRYTEVLDDIFRGMRLPPQEGQDSQDAFFNQFLGKLYSTGFPQVTYTQHRDRRDGKPRKTPELWQVHRDMAASVQLLLEKEVLSLAEEAKKLTGSDNMCLAGGVAMNCVANSVIQNSGLFSEVFIQPGCEDSGIALGAAAALAEGRVKLDTVYTGPLFSDHQIKSTLDSQGVKATRYENIASKVAELLADDQVVGWFQGGLEYGPRGLGARSILANPSSVVTRDRVNFIKEREPWRPFGPSVLAECADDLFEKAHESKYMLRSFTVRDIWRDRLAAVVHVDGSTRPQTVAASDNSRYYEMIKEFEKLTGLPAVLNTSFNSYDEPIVCSPLDAIKTFHKTGLGALAIGNYLVTI